jgi:hypothetical protein
MEVTRNVIDYTVLMCTIQENNAVREGRQTGRQSGTRRPRRCNRCAVSARLRRRRFLRNFEFIDTSESTGSTQKSTGFSDL